MKVLIIKLGAIGDVVMAMPLLTHLHKKYPHISITWVCGQQVLPLLKNTRLIDRLIVVDEKKLLKGSFFAKLSTLLFTWSKLFGRSFDLCLIGYADPRYRLLTWPTLCKKKRSFYRSSKGQFPIPGRYHSYEYLRLAEIAHDMPEFPALDLQTSAFSSRPIIILAPGGAKNLMADDALRRWPVAYYATLIQLLEKLPYEIVVTGSEEDQWVCDHFSHLSYTNLIGKLSLLELTALLKEAKLLITHDSGPLHLGKLVDCATIALFGPTNPWEKVSKNENIRVLWGGGQLACRPCYDGKGYAQCSDQQCLRAIHPQTVFDAVVDILHGERVKR